MGEAMSRRVVTPLRMRSPIITVWTSGLGVGIEIEERRKFIERIAPQRRRPGILEQTLGDRLVARMAMHVDKAGHHHQRPAGDLGRGRARITGAHMQDSGIRKGHVHILRIGMLALGFVPQDSPCGVADNG